MTTLLMSSRHSEDNQALWRAAIKRQWSVVRSRGLNVPDFGEDDLIIYMEALFAQAIAKQLGHGLLEVPEDWLVSLPPTLTKRQIRLVTLGEARRFDEPTFVKPPNDKSFTVKVYSCGSDLPEAFDGEMAVLVATPVQWEVEFRCFCLDGNVVTHSPYVRGDELAKVSGYELTDGESKQAIRTAEQAVNADGSNLPRAVVVDVGKIAGEGWAVVEANAAWGSGIYGCDPDGVLDVIRHATVSPS